MRLDVHPRVYSDIDKIMERYERVATWRLADEFYAEVRRLMVAAAKNPKRFAVRERDVRRANLKRFPFHFLFRIVGETVRVLVVRHHRRHPSYGMTRR
jgi:toxin ParE1/3/4